MQTYLSTSNLNMITKEEPVKYHPILDKMSYPKNSNGTILIFSMSLVAKTKRRLTKNRTMNGVEGRKCGMRSFGLPIVAISTH